MTADESCEKTICEQRLLSEDKLSKSITAGTIAKISSRSGLIDFNFCYVSFDLQIEVFSNFLTLSKKQNENQMIKLRVLLCVIVPKHPP